MAPPTRPAEAEAVRIGVPTSRLLVGILLTGVATTGLAAAVVPSFLVRPGLRGVAPTPAQRAAYDAVAHTSYLLDALWEDKYDGSGGYRTLQNAATPASLYQTVWRLKLASAYNVSIPVVDREQVALRLAAVLEHPTVEDVDELYAIWLSVAGLVSLGAPVPKAPVQAQLTDRQVGGMFGPSRGAPPDWASTAVAVETEKAAGIAVPSLVSLLAARELARITSERVTLDGLLNRLIPIWKVADALLDVRTRAAQRDALAARLREGLALVDSGGGVDALTLFVHSESRLIASENGIALRPFDTSRLETLRTRGGMLSIGPNAAADPQATYYGFLLGLPRSDELVATLRDKATPGGWRADTGDPDARSTFFATAISHVLGRYDHDAAVREQTKAWLRELDVQSADPSALRTDLPEAIYVGFLADEVGIRRGIELVKNVRNLLNSGSLSGWDAIEVDRLLQLVDGPDASSIPAVASLSAAFSGDPSSTQELFARWRVARASGRDAQAATYAQAIGSRSHDGACVADRRSDLPDLRTTLMCRAAVGTSPSGVGVADQFLDPRGIWMFPVASAAQNEINLETTYLGLTLAGLSSDPLGKF